MSAILLLLALLAPSWDDDYDVVETRTIRETIPMEGLRALTVDNIHGSIAATGDGGSDVRMVVTERIEAADRAQLERARSENSLAIERREDRVVVCADGPFREAHDCTEWRRNFNHKKRYRVIYEIVLEVPRAIDLTARTIDGDLVVSGVRGRLEIGGVNGSVDIEGAAGPAVKAGTVNGPVHVRFSENPRDDSTFGTINGDVDIGFQPGMSADLSFETMNGEVMTDFDHENLPPIARRTESRNGGAKYRLEVDAAIRIGRGGPRHRFSNINGDIIIRRN